MPPPVVIDANKVDAKPSDSGANQQSQQESPKRRWGNRRLNTFFAGAVAFFAFVQAMVNGCQWNAMNGQNAIMQDEIAQMKLEKRAWLHAVSKLEDLAPHHFWPEFDVHNYGHLPATIYRARISCDALQTPRTPSNPAAEDVLVDSLVEKSLSAHKKKTTAQDHGRVVPPGGKVTLYLAEPFFVNKELMEQLNTQNARFVVFATIEYSDAIGKGYETQACWMYYPKPVLDPKHAGLGELHEYTNHGHMK